MFDGCLYFNTTALARQLEKEWTKAFAPFGLTPPQAFMLRTILDHPGLPQRELAEAMAISRPTATRALDGLVEKGLAERRSSGRDGREQMVHGTSGALALRKALNEASGKVTKRLKRLLGEEVFDEAVMQIRSIHSVLK
jgi:MarR family transcriptional regulator, temperature-dependent positive regulator of motility